MEAVDIVVCAVVLGLSCLIGIYYAYIDRKNATVTSYFFGSKSMNPVAVGLSLLVSYSSASSFITQPAESYIVGTEFIWSGITRFIAIIPVTVYFVPAFRRLDLKSCYEFVEMRFNKALRKITSFFGIVAMLAFTGIEVYITAVTLSVVAIIPTNWSIAIATVFCIFYTFLGGMKAVIWTDAAQFIFMIAGLLALFIRGIMTIGGFENLDAAIGRGERYTMFRFDYGAISRVSPWARMFGSFVLHFYPAAISQQSVQRYQCCKTTSHARWASSINMVGGCSIQLGLAGLGLVTFALFETCDPVQSGKIQSVDQIIPYTVIYLLSDIPGLTGLYVAAIFSGTLSTVSSTINSLAIVTVEDVLCPFWKRLNNSENLKLSVGKIVVILLGVLVMGVAYVASFSRSNILQLLVSFTGIITGPLTGLYLLGFFCPRTNSQGGTIGFIISVALGLFLFIGKEFFQIPYQSNVPPTFTYGCTLDNTTTTDSAVFPSTATSDITTSAIDVEHSALQDLFNLHFNLLTLIGLLSTFIFGYLISLATGPSDPSMCDPKLFIPLVDNKLLPKSVIKFFRFGVPAVHEWEEKMSSATILEDKL